MQPKEAVSPPEDSDDGAPNKLQSSRMGELEDKVKDLERKVANLFMDNVALTTKLKASQEIEIQQQKEIASLKERLVQALKAQVCTHALLGICSLFGSLLSPFLSVQQDNATQELLRSKARESQLEDEIKVLEGTQSDLEAEVDILEKRVKQLVIDIEQLTKVHIHIPVLLACVCACVRACMHVCVCDPPSLCLRCIVAHGLPASKW